MSALAHAEFVQPIPLRTLTVSVAEPVDMPSVYRLMWNQETSYNGVWPATGRGTDTFEGTCPSTAQYSDNTKEGAQRRCGPNQIILDICLLLCILPPDLGPRPRGRPKRTWREVVRQDCQARKLNRVDAMDRCKWRKMIKDVR